MKYLLIDWADFSKEYAKICVTWPVRGFKLSKSLVSVESSPNLSMITRDLLGQQLIQVINPIRCHLGQGFYFVIRGYSFL